jgi:hypothetical protein
MKRVLALALFLAMVGSVYAADAPQDASGSAAKTTRKRMLPKKAAGPSVSSELQALKEAMDAQQKQIQQLSDQVQRRDQHIQQLEQRLDQSQATASAAQTKADAAASEAAAQDQTVGALKTDVSDLKLNATNAARTLQETQKNIKDALESPMAIHYKGITITPGGFLAAESVYRNRALGSDINTPFNSVSMPGSGANAVSEFFGSGRQSRIAMLAEGKIATAKISGYYEADFLSAGVTSNNNQSNSYTMRQRQVWAQAALNSGWTFTGGQMWSLVTETKKGVDNRSEALPMTIDPQYTVGFSWARQYGFRVSKNFNNHFWLAGSLENPQTILAASGNASNFAFGSPGVGGGLYNLNANYSFNAMPDIVLKAVAQSSFGHFELFGVMSRFRDRVYPCVEDSNPSLCNPGGGTFASSVIGAYNSSKTGGGVGANARVTIAKHTDFGLHALYGNGVGRYGTSGLPDATINPDGTLAPLRSYQGLATLEFHYPKFDVYFNGGEEYVAKRFLVDPVSGKVVGYGAPTFNDAGCYAETIPSSGNGYGFGSVGSCSGNTQSTVEGSFGIWYRAYSGPKGRIQFGPQYSYLVRNAFPGAGATAGTFVAPHGVENMFFTSFRYYLP